MELALALPREREPALYRPRQPRKTPLYRLVEQYYEDVKAVWEDRFEKKYGRWRGFIDNVVWRYLDCGTPEGGFARLRCEDCHDERLLSFSCRQRGICPSCDAKRAARFGALLADEVLEEVPHQMWVFTIPKMLRVYFLHHRELLGELSRAAYETVKELMTLAAFEDDSFRPGMVSVVQTFAEAARFHPHVHALCSRGGWNASGDWIPVPYMDTRKAEELFRHHVFRLLKDKELLSQERIKLLLSWRRSGFSIDDSVRLPLGEQKGLEDVARYMLRAPVSLSRLRWTPGDKEVFYNDSYTESKGQTARGQSIDALEFVARALTQIPQPRKHLLFYYGYYSNAVRGRRFTHPPKNELTDDNSPDTADEPALDPARKAALRRRWADLIRRVFEVDPLICDRCGGQLQVIAFITQPRVIRKILDHLKKRKGRNRPPPPAQSASVLL